MSAVAQTYLRSVFGHALQALLDPNTTAAEAEDAAAVAAVACMRKVGLDEAALSDLMRTVEKWLANERIVVPILRALRFRRTPKRARNLARGIERLAILACEHHLVTSLLVIVRAMQDEPEWRSRIASGWFVPALEHAIARQSRMAVEGLLYGWVRAGQDAEPSPELRACVERNPGLFAPTMTFAPFLRWRVQQVAPTTEGWRALATHSPEDDVPSADLFGSELDRAIETLEAALAEEPEGARRVALARWLSDLRGTP
jgi:hypothetical protein